MHKANSRGCQALPVLHKRTATELVLSWTKGPIGDVRSNGSKPRRKPHDRCTVYVRKWTCGNQVYHSRSSPTQILPRCEESDSTFLWPLYRDFQPPFSPYGIVTRNLASSSTKMVWPMCHDFPSTGAMIWSFTTPKIPPYWWDEVDDVKFIWFNTKSIVTLDLWNLYKYCF